MFVSKMAELLAHSRDDRKRQVLFCPQEMRRIIQNVADAKLLQSFVLSPSLTFCSKSEMHFGPVSRNYFM